MAEPDQFKRTKGIIILIFIIGEDVPGPRLDAFVPLNVEANVGEYYRVVRRGERKICRDLNRSFYVNSFT